MVTEDRTHVISPARRGAFAKFGTTLDNLRVPLAGSRLALARAIVECRVFREDDIADSDLYTGGDPNRVSMVEDEGARSLLVVPLIQNGRGVGSITLYRREVAPFSDDSVGLVESFAAQAVIAIENVRQFRELQTRLEREAASGEVLHVISQSRDDEQPVFEVILECATRLFGAPLAGLHMADETRSELRLVAQRGLTPETLGANDFAIPLVGPNTVARAVKECAVFHSPDLKDDDLYRQGNPSRVAIVDVAGARSALVVPLVSGGLAIGCVWVFRREVRPYVEDEISLLQNFAAQAVIAIENVRQFRELQTRLEREAATRRILEVISRSRDDEQPVFETILENARRLCDATMAAFVLGREGGGPQVMVAQHGATDETLELYSSGKFPMDPEVSTAARAIIQRRSIHLEDMADTDAYRAGHPNFVSLVDRQGIRTNLLVPLISQGEGIGCLILYRLEVRPYTADQIALVETFAAQAVIAIENVRQFRELQSRLEREQGTAEILRLISQSRDDDGPVFDLILEKAAELCGADSAALTFGRAGDPHQRLAAARDMHPVTRGHYEAGNVGMNPETSFAAQAIVTGVPVHVEDFAASDGYREGDVAMRSLVDDTGLRTSLFVPLLSKEGGIGALILFRREVRPYTADQIALVETFAAQAVIAVENVQQFRALERLNAELGERVEAQVGEIERMGRLKRFLSPAVADAVISSGDEKLLSSHRALIAVMFCDIRGFTAFCETAEPEETIEVLQTYHEEMGRLIAEHRAGVDDRSGDGIMVIFNDPLPCDDPAGDALRLALAMRERMADLCRGWKRLGHRLGFGVGVALGYATVGMVGYEGRYEYTASGTAVNLAARLCDEAEDGEILLSPRAYAAVEDDFTAEPRGEITFKGIHAPVEVFRVTEHDRSAA